MKHSTAVAEPTPCLFFCIPAAEVDLFASLNEKAQRIVKRRLTAMRIIHAYAETKSVSYGCRTVASQFHAERGWQPSTLNAIYCAFIESGGDWKSLVDASVAGPKWQNRTKPIGLPEAFLDFLASEWALNQRDKFLAIYSRLLTRLDLWRGGDEAQAIPGYDAPPEVDSLTGRPAGWHYSNLHKAVKPRISKFARKLVQIGPKAASQLGPKILATRVGCKPGQYYILDDSWNDFKVLAFGQSARLLSFHVLDLFSGCNELRGYKPALKNEHEVEERLREREMVWTLVTLLTRTGYFPRGCTIICEKGTATVREREEQILADHCPEIRVERGPRGGGPGIAGLFTGPGGGNPRWKAPLESWFNLLRNRTAGLIDFPAQTGSHSSGLPMPESLPGLEKDTLAYVRAARALPAERLSLLQIGMLKLEEAIFALDAVTELMCNCRTDHALEGWRECGHYVTEWRANERLPWQRAEALLEYVNGEREAICAQLANHPELKRDRALSPREVFEAGRADLAKIPLAVGALLMGDLEGIERPVKQCVIEVSCSEVSSDEPLRFGLVRRNGRGVEEPLRDGEKYLVRVNPMDPGFCWLYNADGSFAGIAQNYGRVRRDDPDALKLAFARKQAALAPLRAEAQRAAAPLTQAATARAAANVHLFDRARPATEAEKADAAFVSEFGPAAAAEILSPARVEVESASDDFLDAISEPSEPQ